MIRCVSSFDMVNLQVFVNSPINVAKSQPSIALSLNLTDSYYLPIIQQLNDSLTSFQAFVRVVLLITKFVKNEYFLQKALFLL